MPNRIDINAAYNYLRDEIKREDQILSQRLTASLTFQGFIITALAFLLSNHWIDTKGAAPVLINIQYFKFYTLIGIGVFGLISSIVSLIGIVASQRSTDYTIDWWEKHPSYQDHIDYFPPAYGQPDMHRDGHLFARLMPISFMIMWFVYLAAMSVKFVYLNI